MEVPARYGPATPTEFSPGREARPYIHHDARADPETWDLLPPQPLINRAGVARLGELSRKYGLLEEAPTPTDELIHAGR